MSFDNTSLYEYKQDEYLFTNRWYKLKGEAKFDTLHGGSILLHLTPSKNDSIKSIGVLHYFDLSEIEANSLTVTGKYKIKGSNETKLSFYLKLLDDYEVMDSLSIGYSNNTGWKDFHLEIPLSLEAREASFSIQGEKNIDLLISNCQAWVDNQPLSNFMNKRYKAIEDIEFDQGSNIELGNISPQMIENMKVLCYVWGFMKYFHPEIVKGNYNWDYELFRIIPYIADTKDKEERNKILNNWIDKYGSIKEDALYVVSDSSKYSRFINLDWISDSGMFNEKITSKLLQIKNAKRSKKFNYYLIPYIKQINDISKFERERQYEHINWEDQGFRILTLFRLWNMIEYCFPYTEYTDRLWSTLIDKFLPTFLFPQNQLDYEAAIIRLAANINDSHGIMLIPDGKFHKEHLHLVRKKNNLPIELILSVEDHIVVKSTNTSCLNRGDIISSINGQDINSIIEEMEPYIIASNKGGFIRKALRNLLSTNADKILVEIVRDNKKFDLEVNDFKSNKQKAGVNPWKIYNLNNRDILHNYGQKSAEDVRDMLLSNLNSKGFILDFRTGSFNNLSLVSELLLSEPPLWISKNDASFPGNYIRMPKRDYIPESYKKPIYKGKLIILVDEYTQSARESWAMWFRTFPNSIIIGRQTAGANGNVCRVTLPGNIQFVYSQLGAYYPNWEILQRNGLKIDIFVSPTIEDITQGRDVWIEKAIEIIESE